MNLIFSVRCPLAGILTMRLTMGCLPVHSGISTGGGQFCDFSCCFFFVFPKAQLLTLLAPLFFCSVPCIDFFVFQVGRFLGGSPPRTVVQESYDYCARHSTFHRDFEAPPLSLLFSLRVCPRLIKDFSF